MEKRVAIIDIGSNSTKLLVANKEGTLFEAIRGVRMGEGLGGNNAEFKLREEVIERNVAAIKELFDLAQRYKPNLNIITGTSAIRDAINGKEFCARIKEVTGVEIRVLNGEEEARVIAKGVATDPDVQSYQEFCLFDLGGGSLECVHYKKGEILLAKSFQLGIVRLTEKYITNPSGKIPRSELTKISEIIKKEVKDFPIKGLPLMGTGGGLSTTKNILKRGSILKVSDLEALLEKLSAITVEERIKEYDIPTYRADVMPVALAIIIELANKAAASAIIYSHFNLRFGLAEEALK